MKLYLITREDLPPGQQAVQAAHALREFGEHHPDASCIITHYFTCCTEHYISALVSHVRPQSGQYMCPQPGVCSFILR